jgi:hypothetical protein
MRPSFLSKFSLAFTSSAESSRHKYSEGESSTVEEAGECAEEIEDSGALF